MRVFEVAGHEVLESYPVDAMCDGAHGTPLIPWPNRLADGRYTFDGVDYQLALTEPATRTAIHGLLRWRLWSARTHTPDRVVMGTVLHPMTGYPFALDVEVDYELDDEGLRVTTTATNIGDRACPYATGQHPYLSAGGGLLDECTLELAASTRIDTDAERQLPIGTEPVAGTDFDFHERRAIGRLAMDFAFTGLARRRGRAGVGPSRADRRLRRRALGRRGIPLPRALQRRHPGAFATAPWPRLRAHDQPARRVPFG